MSWSARRWLSWAEPVYATTVLLMLTLGPVYQLRVRFGGPLFGPDLIDDPVVQQVFTAAYAVALVLLVRRFDARTLRRSPLVALGLFCAVVALSAVWSHDRTRTLSQAVLLAGTSVFGTYLGSRFAPRVQARMLCAALQIGSLVALLAVTRRWVGARDRNGAWTGIYFNRNSLGPVAALALLSTIWLFFDFLGALNATQRAPYGRTRFLSWSVAMVVLVAVDLSLLAGAGSLTPLLGLAAAGGAVGLATVLGVLVRRGSVDDRRATALFRWLAILPLVAVLVGWRRFALAIGRSPTLESRTNVWTLVLETWKQRPLFGQGWMAMWTDSAFQERVTRVANSPLPNAHNGYLEVLLGIGLVGGIVFVVFLAGLVRHVWRIDRVVADRRATWVVAVTAYAFVVNLMETFVGANLLVWVLLVAAGASSVTGGWKGPASPSPVSLSPERAAAAPTN